MKNTNEAFYRIVSIIFIMGGIVSIAWSCIEFFIWFFNTSKLSSLLYSILYIGVGTLALYCGVGIRRTINPLSQNLTESKPNKGELKSTSSKVGFILISSFCFFVAVFFFFGAALTGGFRGIIYGVTFLIVALISLKRALL